VNTVLIALGSNLGPRRATLESAFEELAALHGTRLAAHSALHETAPDNCPPGAGAFLNAAALLHTELDPHELLAELQRIEAAHGRERPEPNAPRTLDLDLVLHGDLVVNDDTLQLPHPRAHTRLFVLEPAAEIAPELRHPVLGRSLRQLRDALRATGSDVAPPPSQSQSGAAG